MCVAIPGRITAIDELIAGIRIATLDVGGVIRRVRLDYLPDATIGDHVVVSMGFAVAVLDEDDANETYEALSAIRDLSDLDLTTRPGVS